MAFDYVEIVPERVYRCLRLCTRCHGLSGTVMPVENRPIAWREEADDAGQRQKLQISGTGGLRVYVTSCECEGKAGIVHEDPALTASIAPVAMHYGLCRVCALMLVSVGSKWSYFVCHRCRPVVRKLNEFSGKLVIPVAWHSIVNAASAGHIPKPPESMRDLLADPGLLADYALQMDKGLTSLGEWRHQMIEFNLKRSRLLEKGRPDFVTLIDYFEACERAKLDSEVRAILLAQSMLSKAYTVAPPPAPAPAVPTVASAARKIAELPKKTRSVLATWLFARVDRGAKK